MFSWSYIWMEVEIEEEHQYGRSVNNQRPLHPQGICTSNVKRLRCVGHSDDELDLRQRTSRMQCIGHYIIGCSHVFLSNWDQKRCRKMSATDARSLRAGVCWPRTPARALISCDAAYSCSAAVVCCTSRLISDARHPRSTRLFANCGRLLLTRHTGMCGCLHELGWPSLVTSERVRICLTANWYKYYDHDHTQHITHYHWNQGPFNDSPQALHNIIFFQWSQYLQFYFLVFVINFRLVTSDQWISDTFLQLLFSQKNIIDNIFIFRKFAIHTNWIRVKYFFHQRYFWYWGPSAAMP